MSVLPGNPSVVASGAQTLQSRAGRIADAIELLRSIALEGKSEALDKIRSKTLSTSNTIQRAEDRYSATGIALSDYATKLRNAHKKADAAEERRRQAQMEQEAWQEQRSRSVQQLRNIENSEVPQHVVDRVQAEYRHADRRADAAGSAVSSAQADIEAARQEMNAAAEHAIGLIEAAIDGTNDTFRDKISNFFAPLVEGFANFINWVGDHLVKLLNGLWEVAKVVFKWIKRILVVVATIVVFVMITLDALVMLGMIIQNPVTAFYLVPLFISKTKFTLWMYEEVKNLLIDVKSEPYVPSTPEKNSAFNRYLNGRKDVHNSILNHMDTMKYVDDLGGEGQGDDEAVVEIKKLEGEPPRWIVTLPSTQDMANGAPNDWLHNVLLKERPAWLPTAYEQKVLAAMRRAGIGPNDEVMVQGFSQGGIMSARLAANPFSGFNITGLITVGSPIDDIPLPTKSRGGQDLVVFSVDHTTDIVPKLDGMLINPGSQIEYHFEEHQLTNGNPNQKYFIVNDPIDEHGNVQRFFGAHSSDLYVNSAAEIMQKNPEIEKAFSKFTTSVDGQPGARVSEYHLVSFKEGY